MEGVGMVVFTWLLHIIIIVIIIICCRIMQNHTHDSHIYSYTHTASHTHTLHRLQQEAVQRQLETLQQALEAKEAQMARLTKGGGQVANLRQHYDKALKELGAERDALQRERRDLVSVRVMQYVW